MRFLAAQFALLVTLALAPACKTLPAQADAGIADVPPTPPQCSECPGDCCRDGDGGFACMNWSRRNPVTFECSCGTGPACGFDQVCCPRNNEPLPQEPPVCVYFRTECDPRASN